MAAGVTVQFTAQENGGNGSPLYEFWVYDPSGKWNLVQSYSSATTYNWIPTQAGTYTIEVWEKGSDSPANYDLYQDMSFTVQ